MREYFENLIKPLVTIQSSEELLCKFKEGVKSWGQIEREQNLGIQEPESKIHLQVNAFKKLKIISDDNEQNSRRSCLRIRGIEFEEGDCDVTMKETENCCNVMAC